MTYNDWHEVFEIKVKDYDWYTCRRALFDCHDTLALRKDLPPSDPYGVKLWAEIDALREQQQRLAKAGREPSDFEERYDRG